MEIQRTQRQKVAILPLSKPNYDEYAFKYFILNLNKLQSSFEFVFPEFDDYYYNAPRYTSEFLFSSFKNIKSKITFEHDPDYYICLITSNIEGNLFFHCSREFRLSFITTDMWEKEFSPPSVFEYLLHCICASLIFLRPEIDADSHHETRGCTLDLTIYKPDDKVDISIGYICDNCWEEISRASGTFPEDISLMIGRKWIGNITDNGSIAYNLKHSFRFDINKDSGFNETKWQRTKNYSKELLKYLITAVAATALTLIVTKLLT